MEVCAHNLPSQKGEGERERTRMEEDTAEGKNAPHVPGAMQRRRELGDRRKS